MAKEEMRTASRLAAGQFTLCAAGVVVDGRGVALIGDAAAGNSTIAATLALGGCPVLADQSLEMEFEGKARSSTPGMRGLNCGLSPRACWGLIRRAGRAGASGCA